MSLKSFRIQARYNILTPIVALGMASFAGAAFANPIFDEVIPLNGSYTNGITIFGTTQAALSSVGDVGTITNQQNGVIQGNSYTGIYIDGNAGSIVNNGFIGSTDSYGVYVAGNVGTLTNTSIINAYDTGIYVDGDIGTFSNSGNIVSTDAVAVEISGNVDSFANSGYLTAEDTGVDIDGDVGTFANSGWITTTSYGVYIGGNVGAFDNSGYITSVYTGVEIGGDVGSFTNSGWILSTSYGVNIEGNTGSFTNSGMIVSTDTAVYLEGDVGTFSNSGMLNGGTDYGVYIDGDVGSFTNSGSIMGSSTAVYIGGDVGTFSNSGQIISADSQGVYVSGDVGTFTNTATGLINSSSSGVYIGGNVGSFTNAGMIMSLDSYGVYISGDADSFSNSGTIVSYSTGVYISGDVGSFANSGSITSLYYEGVYIGGMTETFVNSGTITSNSTGVYFGDDVGSFTNSGVITSPYYTAVYFSDDVESLSNSGEIVSYSHGVYVSGDTGSFDNSGTIHSFYDTAAYFSGTVDAFTNSGAITGAVDYYGVYFGDFVASAMNTGTIAGTTGVYFSDGSGTTLTNGGTIAGFGGTAVQFGSGDDTLALVPGARFLGEVDFGGGSDTLDLTGYRGNIILAYDDTLSSVAPGSNAFVDTGSEVYVINEAGITQQPQQVVNVVGGIQEVLADQLAAQSGGGGADVMGGYAGVGTTSESSGARVWIAGLGGAFINDNADDIDSVYGAGAIGGHVDLGDFTVGVLGGAAASRLEVGNGPQTIDTALAFGGVYGSTSIDLIDVSFSLIGGASQNQSQRTISTQTGDQLATGEYSGWFIAPELGVSVPVLTDDMHDLRIGGRVGWVGGAYEAYTESGNMGVWDVDEQSIGVLTAKLELSDAITLGMTGAGAIKGIVKVAGFVQTNLGGGDTDVTLYDFSGGSAVNTFSVAAPEDTVYGAQVGLGVDVPLTANFNVMAGANAMARSDGAYGGNVYAGVGGNF